jgi:hypothetical protein
VLITKAMPEAKPEVLRAGTFQAFTEDPEVLTRQAAVALRAKLVLALDEIPAQVVLQELLLDMAADYIANALRSDA